jgi:aminoglycoside 3-N-acetyltransferase
MPVLTPQAIAEAYAMIGIKTGDKVFVHSDLRAFGIPLGAHTRADILQFYIDSLLTAVGPIGTIAVPAYFYEYARFGIPFDVDTSPVSTPLGALSQWITAMPKRQRSCSPLQSIAAIGAHAHELAGSNSLSGYGNTSPWHHFRRLKGTFVFLGTTIQSMTYVHYIEQHYGVPHIYFKIYPYPVTKGGKVLQGNVTSAVRYLEFGITYHLKAFHQQLLQQGALRSADLNGVPILAVNAEDAYQIGIHCLDTNPYFFLNQPPQFIAGKIPTDGITGPLL